MRAAARLLAVCVAAAGSALVSARSSTANPLGLFYDNSFTNFEAYEHPTAMLIAGNCNRDDPRFQQARAAGAEVLAYLNPTSVYDSLPCRNKPGLYGHDRERVPLWPYPSYGERVSWKHTHMTDMRPGSAWSNHVVDFVEQLKVAMGCRTRLIESMDILSEDIHRGPEALCIQVSCDPNRVSHGFACDIALCHAAHDGFWN